jgi:sRNA-binding regulator protein Hfq
MTKRMVLSLIYIMMLAIALHAETVYLKDGTIIKGTIKTVDELEVILQTSMGDLVIQKADIDHIDYTDKQPPSEAEPQQVEKKILDQSIYVNPLSMILTPALLNMIEFNFGTMWAVSRYFLFCVNDYFDYIQLTSVLITEIQIGCYINVLGKYLNGPYFGIIGAITSSSNDALPIAFSIMPQVGFQWAFDSGMFMGAAIGYAYTFKPYNIASFRYGVTIGYAYNLKEFQNALTQKQ